MPNKPHELTEEQLKRLEDYECSGQYSCNHETSEKHYIIDKDDLINELTTAHQQGVEAERGRVEIELDKAFPKDGLIPKRDVLFLLANGDV